MGLHRQSLTPRQAANSCEHLRRTGWDETRGEDWTHYAFSFCGFAEESLHCFRGIAQIVRAVAIHSHKPYIRTHSGFTEKSHQQFGGFGMDGGEDTAPHRTLHPQFVYETAIDTLGIGDIAEL